jgi:hypothetical protein
MNSAIDEFMTVTRTLGVVVDDAFENLTDARKRAREVFTCVIAAVGKDHPTGNYYLRPMESNDPNIFAYAVIRFLAWGEGN